MNQCKHDALTSFVRVQGGLRFVKTHMVLDKVLPFLAPPHHPMLLIDILNHQHRLLKGVNDKVSLFCMVSSLITEISLYPSDYKKLFLADFKHTNQLPAESTFGMLNKVLYKNRPTPIRKFSIAAGHYEFEIEDGDDLPPGDYTICPTLSDYTRSYSEEATFQFLTVVDQAQGGERAVIYV